MNRAKYSYKAKSTFIIKLDEGQNNSWQGEVVWADENRRDKFDSALELIKFMDAAASQAAKEAALSG